LSVWLTHTSQASSIMPFPFKSSPTLMSPPVLIGVPIVTNHRQMKIDPAVDRRYSTKGSARGMNDLELMREMMYRRTQVPAYRSAPEI
jgi:hypothetical protein